MSSCRRWDPEARQKAQERRKKEDLYLEQAERCHRALEKHPDVVSGGRVAASVGSCESDSCSGPTRTVRRPTDPVLASRPCQGHRPPQARGRSRSTCCPRPRSSPTGTGRSSSPGRSQGEVFLIEGYIDALAVAATGQKRRRRRAGQTSPTRSAHELRRLLPEDPGLHPARRRRAAEREAARTWGRQFFPQAKICPASYGEGAKDIADTFAREGSEKTGEHLMRLMASSKDMIDIEAEAAAQIEGGPREKLAYATENIVPLLARVSPAGMQDATADIVVDRSRV